ncbi:MAG TPA: PAS domain S-box protein, partial [Holophagaceae bacterium]|nr:PAS domain S-box protein [Holophagaceae bacterium]
MSETVPLSEIDALREALRRSEAKYWDLFDSLPDPAWIFDQETFRFLAVNAAAISRYGWTRDEFLALTVMDIRPEEEVEKLRELFKAFPTRREARGSWRHRAKSGETFFVEVTSHALEFEGRACRISVARDITDRVEAWEALGRTEGRYRELIGSMQEGVVVLDADGRVVFGNPACRRILDIPEAPLEGLDLITFVDPEYAHLVAEERAARRGGRGSTYELKLRPVQGRPRWISVRTSPRFREGGEYDGAFIIFSDITEQRAMVEALRAGEERYRSVIEQAGDMIFLMDLDTKRVVQSNPAFRECLGYEDPEGIGLTLYDLVVADRESVDRNVALVCSQGHYHVGRRQYRHADGSLRDVEVGATALKASGRPLMAVVGRDVTEQLRSEQAL